MLEVLVVAILALPSDERLKEALLWMIGGKSRATYVAGEFEVTRRGPAVVEELLPLLKDHDPYIRAGALHAMALFPKEARQHVRAIIPTLEDKNEVVVLEALELLRSFGPTGAPAVPALAKLLQNKRLLYSASSVPYSAAELLGLLGRVAEKALPELENVAEDPNVRQQVREEARKAIRIIRSELKRSDARPEKGFERCVEIRDVEPVAGAAGRMTVWFSRFPTTPAAAHRPVELTRSAGVVNPGAFRKISPTFC